MSAQMADEKILYSAEMMARLLDLSERRLYQLAAANIIPRVGTKYDGLPTTHAYIKYLRGFSEADSKVRTSFASERARLYRSRADLVEVEKAVKFGKLIPVESIEPSWMALISNFRTKLLSIPSKVASRMVGIKDEARAQAILTDQIEGALNEIANAKLNLVEVRGMLGAFGNDSEIISDDESAAEDDDFGMERQKPRAIAGSKRGTRRVANVAS